MECNELIEQLSEFLDPDARAQLCREIEQHLAHCHNCRLYVDSVKKTIVIAQSGSPSTVPIAVSDQLQAALARAYQAQSKVPSVPAD